MIVTLTQLPLTIKTCPVTAQSHSSIFRLFFPYPYTKYTFYCPQSCAYNCTSALPIKRPSAIDSPRTKKYVSHVGAGRKRSNTTRHRVRGTYITSFCGEARQREVRAIIDEAWNIAGSKRRFWGSQVSRCNKEVQG